MGTIATRRVILFGATGTAGQGALAALVEAGFDVTCVTRRAFSATDARTLLCPVFDEASLARVFQTVQPDAVVSCMASRTGAPADAWAVDYRAHSKMLRAAQAAGVRQWVQLSAICVQKPVLGFQQAKLAFEAEVQASGLAWSIVRPTAFFKSLSGQFDRVRAGKPFLVFGDGRLTACKPISDRDLGRYIAGCLSDPDLRNRVLPIGGPGPAMTPLEQGAALCAALRQPVRFRKVPVWMMDGITGVLGALGKVWPGFGNKAELARIGRYYATESMLVMAPDGHYDAEATPETGQDRLTEYFADLAAGRAVLDRGDHAVF